MRVFVNFFVFVYFCGAEGVSFIPEDKYDKDLQVETGNGMVQGKKVETNFGNVYYFFQGIPYAKPPLANLRFRAPKPATNWTGVLDATKEASTCIELLFRSTIQTNGSEDCLYLNVFTPQSPHTIKTPLPVMLWIYGGAFIEGNSKEEYYGPEHFLREDVIIVTFNYRLGLYGFLSSGDMASPGNYGLKDQNRALKWVNANIRNFGGDPRKVTLFGQSAGAASVLFHMQSPKSRNLFQTAIAESGSSICSFALRINPSDILQQIADGLNLNTKDPSAIVAQMRKMEVEKLNQAQMTTTMINFMDFRKYGMPFAATLEPNHKNAFLTNYMYEALSSGNFAKVPLIIGLNSFEAIQFKEWIGILRPLLSLLWDSSPGLLAMPNLNTKNKTVNREFGLSLKNYYFKDKYFLGATDEEIYSFFNDDVFVRPITKTAKLLSKYVPTYFYTFTYEGTYTTKGLDGPTKREILKNKGVAHSEELWYLWKRKDIPYLEDLDQYVSKQMVKMWTNFAKYGNPTPVAEDLFQNLIWPPVNPTSEDIIYLDINKRLTIEKNYRSNAMQFWENSFKTYGRRPFRTY